jgi:hypothetical protein
MSVMNLDYVADALDRILSNPNDPRNAKYLAWRETQGFGVRETLTLYPYDSPRTLKAA